MPQVVPPQSPACPRSRRPVPPARVTETAASGQLAIQCVHESRRPRRAPPRDRWLPRAYPSGAPARAAAGDRLALRALHHARPPCLRRSLHTLTIHGSAWARNLLYGRRHRAVRSRANGQHADGPPDVPTCDLNAPVSCPPLLGATWTGHASRPSKWHWLFSRGSWCQRSSGEHSRSGLSGRNGVRLTTAQARKTALVTAEPRSSIRTPTRQRGQHNTRSANVLASPRQPRCSAAAQIRKRLSPGSLALMIEGRIYDVTRQTRSAAARSARNAPGAAMHSSRAVTVGVVQ